MAKQIWLIYEDHGEYESTIVIGVASSKPIADAVISKMHEMRETFVKRETAWNDAPEGVGPRPIWNESFSLSAESYCADQYILNEFPMKFSRKEK